MWRIFLRRKHPTIYFSLVPSSLFCIPQAISQIRMLRTISDLSNSYSNTSKTRQRNQRQHSTSRPHLLLSAGSKNKSLFVPSIAPSILSSTHVSGFFISGQELTISILPVLSSIHLIRTHLSPQPRLRFSSLTSALAIPHPKLEIPSSHHPIILPSRIYQLVTFLPTASPFLSSSSAIWLFSSINRQLPLYYLSITDPNTTDHQSILTYI